MDNRLLLSFVVLVVCFLQFAMLQSPMEAKALDDLRLEWNLTRIGWEGNANTACASQWTGIDCTENHIVTLYVIHIYRLLISLCNHKIHIYFAM